MKAVVTVVGTDRVGIIAAVSTQLATYKVNILDISQTIMQEYFTMIMLVDVSNATLPFAQLQESMDKMGEQMGLSIRMQHEGIFNSMHKL